MRKIIYYSITVLFTQNLLFAGFFPFDLLKKHTAQLFVNEYEEKKQLLTSLQENLARAQRAETTLNLQLNQERATVQKQSDELTRAGISRDIVKKKQALINDSKQLLNDIQRTHQQTTTTIKKSIDVLKSYLDDALATGHRLAEKSWYSFEELQTTAKQFYAATDELQQCKDNKKHVDHELQSIAHALETQEQDLKQQASARDTKQLSGLELGNLRKKIEYSSAKKELLSKEFEYTQLQEFVLTKKVEALRKELTHIERTLWVTDVDVQHEQEHVNTLKNAHNERREVYLKELAIITKNRDAAQKEFERANTALKQPITDLQPLSEWHYSTTDEPGFYHALVLYAQLQSLESTIALMDARQALDDAQLMRDELTLETMKTWAAISQRRFLHNSADHTKQLELFITKKKELDHQIDEYTAKNSALVNRSTTITRTREQLQRYLAQEPGKKTELQRASTLLHEAQQQLDELAKVQHSIIAVKTELANYLDLIVQKLSSTSSVFQRAAGAITLEGIKNAGADIRFFVDYIGAVLSTKGLSHVITWFKDLMSDVVGLLSLFFALIIAIAVYFVGLLLLPLLQQVISRIIQQHGVTFVPNTILMFVQFVRAHLLGLISWLTLFYVLRYDWAITVGTPAKIMFYLISIWYWCALATKLKRFYINASPTLFQKDFARRALTIIHVFIVLTVTIYFLSEALVTTVYGHSALSRSLWALYSLIIRALMVLLVVDKAFILSIIPERGVVWSTIHEQISRFYYVFLLLAVLLIILSDPFIGYGLLVTTIIKAALLTIAVLLLFRWLHEFLRQYSSHIFFITNGEGAKERFAHGKTWYALFIIVSFGILIIGAILLFARIWGHPLSVYAVANFFDIEIARVPGDIAGTIVSITLKSLLVVIAFIFGGFLLATLFNRYVLQRIYLLLHIDAGIQNTISRISGYLFIIIPLILGLQRAGFGSWIPSLAVLLMLGIAWAVKGPADDFFAYFIILVERSIKIGDYIRVESLRGDISGVVRKITPRSVVLRRRNSYTVIVPNSKVLRTYIYNWNYSHTYIGFDDIYLTVAFEADQEKVRELLLKILHENPLILKNPAPVIRIDNFTINGYEIMIRAFLSSSEVLNQWDIRSDIRFAILREFKKNNIKFAAPIHGIKLDINRPSADQ